MIFNKYLERLSFETGKKSLRVKKGPLLCILARFLLINMMNSGVLFRPDIYIFICRKILMRICHTVKLTILGNWTWPFQCFPVFFKQLLYFAVDPDPLEGFLRGLSLVANQPMPSSKSLVHLPQPMTEEYGGDVSVPQIQVCKTSLSINDLWTESFSSANGI